MQKLYINHSPLGGKGVFAGEEISIEEIIELCPVIVLNSVDLEKIHQTQLHDYYFLWGENAKECAIALGYGSLYNHSFNPNAEYVMDFEYQTITIIALKDINIGDEITINYNGDSNKRDSLWFLPK